MTVPMTQKTYRFTVDTISHQLPVINMVKYLTKINETTKTWLPRAAQEGQHKLTGQRPRISGGTKGDVGL